MSFTYNYNVVLGLSFTGITLVQTVKDLDNNTIAGLTATFTEVAGGDYICKIIGLDDDFTGYVVVTNAAGGGHLAVENIYDKATSADRAEPGLGAPSESATLAEKVDYLYKSWRNKKRQVNNSSTNATWELYDDAGTTVDQQTTIDDDDTEFNVSEITTG